jgi:hypothetical protein
LIRAKSACALKAKRGDFNIGHEYGTIHAPAVNGEKPEPLTDEERWDLVEYIKTL